MKISKENLKKWLDTLTNKYNLLAPVSENGGVNYKKVKSTDEIKFNYLNSKTPVKSYFFPQYEKLVSYEVKGKDVEIKAPVKAEKTVIFGVRPCDSKSLQLLDKVFNNNTYRDSYYCDKRDNAVIIGLGCQKMSQTCFCSSLGLSPTSNLGSDIFLIDLGDSYFVEVLTQKGKDLLASLKDVDTLTDADNSKVKAQKALTAPSSVDVENITKKLDTMFEHPYWDTLHEKCLGCNACSFSCPTCHCFDMREEVCGNKGDRVRTWDGCMAPLFTLHGSGHNPRENKKARWRQRLMHKFNYFVHNNGEMSCVGCGRCIRNCPVNFDIRQAIDGVNKAEAVVK